MQRKVNDSLKAAHIMPGSAVSTGTYKQQQQLEY